MSTMTEAALRLILGDGISGLAQAQQRLTSFLTAAGCDARTRFRVELVVEEVVMNILHHGQLGDRPARSWLEAWPAHGHVAIVVEDDGPEFDPLQVVSAPLANRLEEAAIGGLGLFLVRKYAAGLRYARTPAGRNRLEIEILRAD
jgi:anti-sigma regulatory factor (Ser/Thr protein kinase)